jgi:DNA-binding winged helix-turn-helix (wHTH) protein/Tol biopolymer transport system component
MVSKQLASNLVDIGNIRVDFTAGSLVVDGIENIVEPKVIEVLQILAEHPGEIVSQEAIFERVWPRSIYSPSSIQRCIAVLRKAMLDDAKTQSVIKTHPKRGYSLLPDVKVATDHQSMKSIEQKGSLNRFVYPLVLVLVCIGVFGFAAIEFEANGLNGAGLKGAGLENKGTLIENTSLSVVLSPLSASENNHSHPSFSADLAYLAYIESSDSEVGSLIIQNQQSQLSYQPLIADNTIEQINVISYAWSPTSHSLLALVKRGSQFVVLRVNIQEDEFKGASFSTQALLTLSHLVSANHLQWDGQSYIYYLAETERRLDIRQHHIIDDKFVELALPDNWQPYFLALSVDYQQVAIIADGPSIQPNGQIDKEHVSILSVFDLTTNQLQMIKTLYKGTFDVVWRHPLSENAVKEQARKWLLNDGKTLSMLDEFGQQTKLNFHSLSIIDTPSVDKLNRVALTLRAVDQDVWLIDRQTNSESVVVSSTAKESSASISHSSDKIAFVSQRKGYPQLYIKDGFDLSSKERLAFANADQAQSISWPRWSADDKSLWITVDGSLRVLNVETETLESLQWAADIDVLQVISVDSKQIYFVLQESGQLKYAVYHFAQQRLSKLEFIPQQSAIGLMASQAWYKMKRNQYYQKIGDDWLAIHDTQADYVSMDLPCQHGFLYTAVIGNQTELRHWQQATDKLEILQRYASPNVVLLSANQDESQLLVRKQQQETDIVLLEVTNSQ